MKTIRSVSQLLSLAFFLCFFFVSPAGDRWLLRLNPVSGLLTLVASRHVAMLIAVAALPVIMLTVVSGRLFCGFFCPLGTVIDLSDRLLGRIRLRRRPPVALQSAKYVLLLAIAVAALGGWLFTALLDPLSIVSRFLTVAVHPLAIRTGELLQPLITRIDPAYAPVPPRMVHNLFGVCLVTVAVLAGGIWDRRFWCQYVCPTGAGLGLLSRFALFRRRSRPESCSSCGLCARICPTRAIGGSDCTRTVVAECILCGECVVDAKSCTKISIGKAKPGDSGPDLTRRHLIGGAAAGVALIPTLGAGARGRVDGYDRLIRPPGARPEDLFLARCIACSRCMEVCPTSALQPSGIADGLGRWQTPKLVPRIGPCEEKCTRCGAACPTGAIRPLPYEEKRFAKIGTAVVERSRCIAWSKGGECLICSEVCPYNAICAVTPGGAAGTARAPVVKNDLCMGCGQCEKQCPVGGKAAITVYRAGENRRASGPYAGEAEKRAILDRRRRTGDGGSGGFF